MAADEREYIQMIGALVVDGTQRQRLRDHLLRARESHALFDAQRRARELEAAMTLMHRRRLQGLDPEPLQVPPHSSPIELAKSMQPRPKVPRCGVTRQHQGKPVGKMAGQHLGIGAGQRWRNLHMSAAIAVQSAKVYIDGYCVLCGEYEQARRHLETPIGKEG